MDQVKHKQDNFFLFFPVYVCLGVYYLLRILATPFINLWETLSDALYNKIRHVDTESLEGANLTKEDKLAEMEPEEKIVETVQKQVKISDALMQSREELVKSIESSNEVRSDKIVTYRYTAINPEGKKVTDIFRAYSKVEAFTFLENEGYQVLKIESGKMIDILYGTNVFSSTKIKTGDLVFWLQQLSTYLKAGIPLTDAMRILSKQMGKNDNIKRTFDAVVYNLTLGENFSSCLERQGDAFPSLLVNMIKSAEATGDLEGTLDDMAEYYGQTDATRKEMKSALTYPIMVMIFAIGVVVFILVYLIPQFVRIYETADVPINGITQFIITLSNFLRANILTMIVAIAVVVVIIVVLYKNIKAFRYFLQSIAMRIPVFGKMIIYKEMMIFTKTFSSLLRNNVFITESMDILVKVTNNEIYREIIINTINCIGRGDKISSAFKNHWAIPEVAYYMMVTGESTGQLAEMMSSVSEYYKNEHKNMVNTMKSLIEPALIMFLAVIVGGIIIAVIVPMFSLYSDLIGETQSGTM